MLLKDLQVPTPIQKIETEMGVFFLKREDLNHPSVQGNKWRKLKYNLEEFINGDYKGIVSFGGAFSNHVYALASACKILSITCKLYLRGYTLDQNNPTVKYIIDCGVEIELLSPTAYREKSNTQFINTLLAQSYYVIPEGGTNELGIKGVEELGMEIIDQLNEPPDYICVSAGTGGTAIGLIKAFANVKTEVLVFSSLKGDFLREVIEEKVGELSFELITDFHFGGYGKFNKDLVSFCNSFKGKYQVPLDPVYTGKMMYGIDQMMKENCFKTADKVLAIHTGGLQGVAGFNYSYGEKLGALV